MKKQIAAVLAGLLMTTSLFAAENVTGDTNLSQEVFRITDDSPYAQLCLAVLESREALHKKAKELRIRRKHVEKVECNGVNINAFARAHESAIIDPANIATVQ